jgi:hypothetical protein
MLAAIVIQESERLVAQAAVPLQLLQNQPPGDASAQNHRAPLLLA